MVIWEGNWPEEKGFSRWLLFSWKVLPWAGLEINRQTGWRGGGSGEWVGSSPLLPEKMGRPPSSLLFEVKDLIFSFLELWWQLTSGLQITALFEGKLSHDLYRLESQGLWYANYIFLLKWGIYSDAFIKASGFRDFQNGKRVQYPYLYNLNKALIPPIWRGAVEMEGTYFVY